MYPPPPSTTHICCNNFISPALCRNIFLHTCKYTSLYPPILAYVINLFFTLTSCKPPFPLIITPNSSSSVLTQGMPFQPFMKSETQIYLNIHIFQEDSPCIASTSGYNNYQLVFGNYDIYSHEKLYKSSKVISYCILFGGTTKCKQLNQADLFHVPVLEFAVELLYHSQTSNAYWLFQCKLNIPTWDVLVFNFFQSDICLIEVSSFLIPLIKISIYLLQVVVTII